MRHYPIPLTLLALWLHVLPAGATVYVAPAGNDANDGTAAHPLATLVHARDLCRSIAPGQPREITLAAGNYFAVDLVLGPQDSGLTITSAPSAPSAPGATASTPTLYGGIRLAGWQKDGPDFYAAALPAGLDPALAPRLLEVDGAMAPRARLPETGTFTHTTKFDVPWMSSTGGGWKRQPTTEELTTLAYNPADLGAWLVAQNAEVTVYHMWDESTVGVAAVDAPRHVLTLAPPCGHPPGAFNVHQYVVWNLREGMRHPGQWYHDRAGGRIVYWPLPGQDMAKSTVFVPTTQTVIRLAGTAKTPVHDVTLQGLTIHVTTVPLRSGGFAAANFDGAMALDHAHNCRLSGLEISRVAGHAINGHNDLHDIIVEHCRIGPCGAGGIYIGGTKPIIRNNRVAGIGLLFPSAIGIYHGGDHGLVSHNLVHDCSYSAINYGGNANILEGNLIYDCMKTLHDGAAIYLFGARDCIIRGNLARDITDTGGYGASAWYLDEQSQHCLVENNVALRVHYLGNNHMAHDCILRNNVYVVPAGDAKLSLARSKDFTFEKNIIWCAGKIEFHGVDAITTWSGNVLYSGSGKIVGTHLKDYSATGSTNAIPGESLAADPLFVDLEHDWHFKPNSPAPARGILPVDVSTAGPQGD